MLCPEVRASTGSRRHCRLVDRREEGLSDDESQRQAVKSNDFLYIGQRNDEQSRLGVP